MQSHRGLDHSEVGAHVSAVGGEFAHEGGTEFAAQGVELIEAKPLDVGGRVYFLEIYFHR